MHGRAFGSAVVVYFHPPGWLETTDSFVLAYECDETFPGVDKQMEEV